MRCSYCYQRTTTPRRMEWPVARAAVDAGLSMPGSGLELTFYGGEPLLEFGLMRRAVEHAEAHRAPGTRVSFRVVTNGTLLTDDVTGFLAEHNVKVVLSFDGVRPAQRLRSKDSFDALDRLLDHLRRTVPDYFRRCVGISMTVPPPAVPLIADSVEYFLAKGVQEIDLTPVITPWPGWDDRRVPEIESQFHRVLALSLEHLERTGEVPLLMYAGTGRASGPRPATRAMCEVVDGGSLAVDVDGTVAGCTLFAPSIRAAETPLLAECRSVMSLGSVLEPGLGDRLAKFRRDASLLDVVSRKEEKYSSYRKCGECRFFGACVICPVSIGRAEGNSDPNRVPDYYCAFNYAALSTTDGFPVQPTVLEVIRGDRFRELRAKWREMGKQARSAQVGRP